MNLTLFQVFLLLRNMGIPHLKRNLEPYAERGAIAPCNVVVDGPALAYHVLSLASRTTIKTSPFEQPSYELLGRTAIQWLEKMEECGLTMYLHEPPIIHNCRANVSICSVRTSTLTAIYPPQSDLNVCKDLSGRPRNSSSTIRPR